MGEKLSLTRVLAEIKLIDKKIESAKSKKYIGLYQKKSNFVLGSLLNEVSFKKEASENLQSIQDLVLRKEKLKMALSKANANTFIKIKDKTFSISEAISYKQSVLPLFEDVVNTLKNQFVKVLNDIEKNRKEVEEAVLKMLEQNLGKDRKADASQYDAIAKPFIEQNEYLSTDPENKLKFFVDNLEKDIFDFKSEIDFALSEINAKTEIEI